MTIKLTALLTSACVVCLFVLSLTIPGDPFFFFVSPNLNVSLVRLFLVVGMIFLTTKRRFKYKVTSPAVSWIAAVLVGFGLAGLAIPSLDYALYNVFKPLDYIYFVGTGLYIGYFSLIISPGRRRLPLPKFAQHLPFLRLAGRLSRA